MAHHSVVQRLETLLQTDVPIRRGLAEAARALSGKERQAPPLLMVSKASRARLRAALWSTSGSG